MILCHLRKNYRKDKKRGDNIYFRCCVCNGRGVFCKGIFKITKVHASNCGDDIINNQIPQSNQVVIVSINEDAQSTGVSTSSNFVSQAEPDLISVILTTDSLDESNLIHQDPNNFEYIKSKRYNLLIFHQKYLYVCNRTYKETKYYICRQLNCPSRAIFTNNQFHVKSKYVHTHIDDLSEYYGIKTRNSLKNAMIANPFLNISTIYSNVMVEVMSYPDIHKYPEAIPPLHSVIKMMKRVVPGYVPFLPQDTYSINLTNYNNTLQGLPFLLAHTPNKDIIIYGTLDFLKLMCSSKNLYMDGTFFTAPTHFTQLYTIHVLIGKSMICVIFAILPDKRKSTYIKFLEMVKDKCALHGGLLLEPESIQIDFEISMKLALLVVFPYAVIRGCFFHYGQSLWRKIQSLSLTRDYKERADVQGILRRIFALPFCNPSQLSTVYTQTFIESEALNIEALRQFMLYFSKTYICTNNFNSTFWSRYNVEGPRTNNNVEGFHNGLKKLIKTAHPDIYTFISKLQIIQANMELKLQQ
ncbi:unnamed protein product [Gordionus sp. m RMFG-2023]